MNNTKTKKKNKIITYLLTILVVLLVITALLDINDVVVFTEKFISSVSVIISTLIFVLLVIDYQIRK